MMRGIIIHDNTGDNVVMTIVGISYRAINKDRERSAFRDSRIHVPLVSTEISTEASVANFFKIAVLKLAFFFICLMTDVT